MNIRKLIGVMNLKQLKMNAKQGHSSRFIDAV